MLESEIPRILEALDNRNIKSTFFCLGCVAQKHPAIIKQIHNAGHQIASHGFAHELITFQTQAEFAKDLKKSVDCIEQIIGEKINCYRAPGFSVNKSTAWMFETLLECELDTDSSVVFSGNFRYGGFKKIKIDEPFLIEVNGTFIKEYPISTKEIFFKRFVYSGGGYFRFFPYHLIRRWTIDNTYVMTYFHYRDFYADQPILPGLSFSDKFYSYYGLKAAYPKFEKYLNDFEFSNILDFDKTINWNDKQIIKLQNLLQ
jgi:polysaccharide deacetylase family protein (PEP-CTERM system associated)